MTPTTRAINSTVDITISEHNSVSPTNAAADIRTTQSVNPRPSGPRQSDTSAASNGILDITPSKPPPCREGRIPLTNKSFTIEEMEEAVEKIVTHLSVNRAALSSVKRSKVSAPDDRVSSTTIGMAGMVFVGVVLGLIFISDIIKLVYDFRLAFGNIKKPTKLAVKRNGAE